MLTNNDIHTLFEFSANKRSTENKGPVYINHRKVLTHPFPSMPLISTDPSAPLPLSLNPSAPAGPKGYTFPVIFDSAFSSFSIEFYFRAPSQIDSSDSKTCFLVDIGDIHLYLFLRNATNYLRLRVGSSNAIDVRDVIFEPSKDYHVFITYSSTLKVLSLYLDGILRGTFTVSTAPSIPTSTRCVILGTERYGDNMHYPTYFYYCYVTRFNFTTTPVSYYLTPSYKNSSFEPLTIPERSALNLFNQNVLLRMENNWTRGVIEGKVTFEDKTQVRHPSSVLLTAHIEGLPPDKKYVCIAEPNGAFKLHLNSFRIISKPFKVHLTAIDLKGDFNLIGLSSIVIND